MYLEFLMAIFASKSCFLMFGPHMFGEITAANKVNLTFLAPVVGLFMSLQLFLGREGILAEANLAVPRLTVQ